MPGGRIMQKITPRRSSISAAGVIASSMETPTTPTQKNQGKLPKLLCGRTPTMSSVERREFISRGVKHGEGRQIPKKQGVLFKRRASEWKKKYVCLQEGYLTYYDNVQQYCSGKVKPREIYLGLTTVKVGGLPVTTPPEPLPQSPEDLIAAYKFLWPHKNKNMTPARGCEASGGSELDDDVRESPITTRCMPRKRSGHRRTKSEPKKRETEQNTFEIICSNESRFTFRALTTEERDEWVQLIYQQIEHCLQATESHLYSEIEALRLIDGNDRCADCGAWQPAWTSINHCVLICHNCCGVHRNLGTHISKVRSLTLDALTLQHVQVLQVIGNERANRILEARAPQLSLPDTRAAKEAWIRAKYAQKRFLAALPANLSINEAICAQDLDSVFIHLLRGTETNLEAALRLACHRGCVDIVHLLLSYNADVKALDENGLSAMWYALDGGSEECVDVLESAGLQLDYGIGFEGVDL